MWYVNMHVFIILFINLFYINLVLNYSSIWSFIHYGKNTIHFNIFTVFLWYLNCFSKGNIYENKT